VTIKYAIHPGPVISKTDGDRHFVTADQLIALYQVDPQECVVVFREPLDKRKRKYWGSTNCCECDGLIQLRPRYDGNYTLPEVTK